jgi:prepilin-type N-terminal cleavage/methylation domain-containing protein
MIFDSKKQSGFTIIETVISMAVLTVITLSVYDLILQALKISQDNKLKMASISLADQKLEQIRNLPYDSVGTLAGAPHGVVPDNESATTSNGTFYVNTLIMYKDDAFDGLDPADTLPNDYKEVRVRVQYNSPFGFKKVESFTKIAPKALETSSGGGTLEIQVINANGQPVDAADVTVINNNLASPVNVTAPTGADGYLRIYGAKPSIENYQIIATKAGYSLSSTTARTASNPNPTLLNQSVFVDQKTTVTLSIDLVSTLRLHTVQEPMQTNWRVNTDAGTDNQTNPHMAIDPNGYIYMVWQDFRQGSAGKIYAQKYDKDGAKQWANDVVISPANNQILPEVAVDNAGHLYICWNDDSNGNQDVFLVKRASNDGSDLWGGSKQMQTDADNKDQIKCKIDLSNDFSRIYVTWQDNRNGDADIFMQALDTVSHDALWDPEIRVDSTTVSGGTNQTTPISSDDNSNDIFVFWADDRNANQDIYAQKYNPAGTKLWGADLLVNSDGGSTNQYAPSVAVSSSTFYISWTDERNGNLDVYAQRVSATGTRLWASDLLVNTDGGTSAQYSPSVAIGADVIYIAWGDERNGNQDIYAQKLLASSTALWSPDVRVNINPGSSAQFNPRIAYNVADGKPYAVWQDDRAGNFDIFATSFDAWGASTTLTNIPVVVTGAKKIGENPIIYKYSRSFVSDAAGLISINNMEWDSYTLTIGTPTPYMITLTQPASPVSLSPNTALDVDIFLK